MLSEGTAAPAVTLPGYVDGDRRRVDLGEYLGDGIVVLAFYPSDFNPACSMQESDLGDLDLFTMQKDVEVFGISPDSTYSHEAFAERYSLKVPLLSDADGEAAAAYGVELESDVGEPLCKRAVFVVDHRGTVQYAWATDDLEEGVDVDPVKRAVGDIGGDETALERYRVGYEHYVAGQEAFTEAMAEYEDREWLVARGGFQNAEPEFASAADHFDTAVRFAETDDFETVVDRAEEKADTLQHAANWLAESADALGSGRGKQGKEYREDADRLLSAADDLPEPPEGDAFTLVDAGIELEDSIVVDSDEEGEEAYAWRADDGEPVDTELAVDDEALDAAAAEDGGPTYDEDSEGDAVEGDLEMDLDAVEAADDDDGDEASIEGDTVEGDLEMDLDAIEAAQDAEDEADRAETDSSGTDPSTDGADGDAAATVDPATGAPDAGAASTADEAPAAGADGDEEATSDGEESTDDEDDVEELDLADPTAGEGEEEDDERADWDIPGR